MKYIKPYRNFINESWSPLLKLSDNQDNDLINKVESLLDKDSSILEISCGNSADAIKLKELGYNITCTDNNSEYVKNCNDNGIECIEHNTENKFPFENDSFDLVYCRLGLHYFETNKLESIFSDINRICKKYLIFSVKLANNEETGKVILTKEVWENLTSKHFKILESNQKSGILYGLEANWLEIIAEKN